MNPKQVKTWTELWNGEDGFVIIILCSAILSILFFLVIAILVITHVIS